MTTAAAFTTTAPQSLDFPDYSGGNDDAAGTSGPAPAKTAEELSSDDYSYLYYEEYYEELVPGDFPLKCFVFVSDKEAK